jgi:glycosyltransferase involved in cell wall biosynthesis
MSYDALTTIALAWREGQHLRECFRSIEPLRALTGCATLIVLDSDADPLTRSIAGEVADRVVEWEFVNFARQRNKALDLAQTKWVLFIDPDERCTPQLAEEIAHAIGHTQYAAYRLPRRNILFGHEVRHAGWWPDYQVRLVVRDKCRYDERREVHEVPIVQGAIGTLCEPLVHYNYESWGQFVAKQRSYAPLEARALYRQGRRARLRSLIGQPVREFKRRFFDYEGYKDGPLGLALSLAMALYTAEVYRRLLVLQRRARSPRHTGNDK